MVRRHRRTARPAARSGAAALVGRSALAIEPVNRVELKAIDAGSIKDLMEKVLRADRDKRAAILTAEGARQAQILTARAPSKARS